RLDVGGLPAEAEAGACGHFYGDRQKSLETYCFQTSHLKADSALSQLAGGGSACRNNFDGCIEPGHSRLDQSMTLRRRLVALKKLHFCLVAAASNCANRKLRTTGSPLRIRQILYRARAGRSGDSQAGKLLECFSR